MNTDINDGHASRLYQEGMTIEEQAVVYGCFNEGFKVSEIQNVWSRIIHRIPLSNRQLYLYRERWVKGGKKSGMDNTANWADRKSFLGCGILVDHLPILNDMTNWMVHEFRGFLPKPTYRLLYWSSYVLSLAPELKEEVDLFMLSTQLALRDMVYSYTTRDREQTDLDDLLSYRPWRSPQRDEKYRSAQIRGDASGLKEIAPVLQSRYRPSLSNSGEVPSTSSRATQTSISENEIGTPTGRQMLFLGMIHKMCLDEGFVLPSVRMQTLRSEGINPIEINFSNELGSTVRTRY